MSNYRTGNGGHATAHVRDTFLEAVEAFASWSGNGPEPTVDYEVGYGPRRITLTEACGLVWNCTDTLPSHAEAQLAELTTRGTWHIRSRGSCDAAVDQENAGRRRV